MASLSIIAANTNVKRIFNFKANLKPTDMKRIFYLLAIVMISQAARAANGDTTWVQAHTEVKMDHYGDFDSTVTFPDGSKNYRKIYMIFSLGKYICPGSPQYCYDWDYTVQNFLMTPGGDTVELGRLITPYADVEARMPVATWKGKYVFDVTDYYPLLKNSGTMRVHYSGYSWGFTGDIKFAFIEGTPERNVTGIDRLWHGSFLYGKTGNPIDSRIQQVNKTPPAGTQAAELKFNISGHGSDNSGCSEFCKKYYEVKLNGSQVAQKDIWRDDCGSNHIYPQNGTWIFDRGNWCPGDRVNVNNHVLQGVSGGTAYDIDVDFEGHTSSGNDASYIIEGQVIYYGAMNKSVDASVDGVIAPTDNDFQFRNNDFCGEPRIKVKNTGSTAISSIKLQYGVVGTTLSEYTWSGSLAALAETEITLPEPWDLRELSLKDITTAQTFIAKIMEVNGQADEDVSNNEMTSTFKPVPHWPTEFTIALNTNKPEVNGTAETSWKIYFMDGNIAAQRSNTAITTNYLDTVRIGPGCYKLVVEDKGCDGVNWWAYNTAMYPVHPGYGSVGAKKLTGTPITAILPLKGYFNGDFGCGFTQYFTVGWPLGVEYINSVNAGIAAYPNPASNAVTVAISGLQNVKGTLQVVDALGRTVMQSDCSSATHQLNVSALSNGMYTIIYRDTKEVKLQTRVLVAH